MKVTQCICIAANNNVCVGVFKKSCSVHAACYVKYGTQKHHYIQANIQLRKSNHSCRTVPDIALSPIMLDVYNNGINMGNSMFQL